MDLGGCSQTAGGVSRSTSAQCHAFCLICDPLVGGDQSGEAVCEVGGGGVESRLSVLQLMIAENWLIPRVGRNKNATEPLLSVDPQSGEESKKLHNPCRLRAPRVGTNQNGSISPESWGPQSEDEAKGLQNPCHLRVPERGGIKNGYITPAVSGSPERARIKKDMYPLLSGVP